MISKTHQHFQHRWLEKNPGLVYSESQSGGYSKYCVLFGKTKPTVKELGAFVTRPFTNFKKATELLGKHFHGLGDSKGNKTHQNAVQDAIMFVRSMENIDARIDFQLNTANCKTAAENRLKL